MLLDQGIFGEWQVEKYISKEKKVQRGKELKIETKWTSVQKDVTKIVSITNHKQVQRRT